VVAALVRWAVADAGRRGRPGWAVALLVVAAPVVGWLVWLALRPQPLDAWRREVPAPGPETSGQAALIACLALAWYNVGTTWLSQRVLYPLRGYVALEDASTYQEQYARLIQMPVVTGFALLLLATAVLIWLRPPDVPEWSAWGGAALEALAVWASLTRDLPIQVRMATEGFSPALNAELVGGSWVRTAAVTAHGLLLAWMARRAMESRGILRGGSRWSL
jgi:cytochrome b561